MRDAGIERGKLPFYFYSTSRQGAESEVEGEVVVVDACEAAHAS